MPRPRRCCRVSGEPTCRKFKPSGIPARELEEVTLAVEELEALRLGDMEGLYHETAAQMMGVSRATFGRILQDGRKKVATALVSGQALKIDGGNYEMSEQKEHVCCGRGRKNRTEAGEAAGCGCEGKGHGHQRHGGAGECKGEGHGGHGHGHGCCRSKAGAEEV
ncbi:MAG: DUF134 domain-containing protein [Desulfovibrio sp.]|nr:DUF134 domain-containing protein [Desulfovibrio sp.]MBI4960259.1 DUF134 domain-containing protein [Desulfovibrio sp.]